METEFTCPICGQTDAPCAECDPEAQPGYDELSYAREHGELNEPLQIVVTDSAHEVHALRNLLRHAAAALDPAKRWPEWEREALSEHIAAVLRGDADTSYAVCVHCEQEPIHCQCER